MKKEHEKCGYSGKKVFPIMLLLSFTIGLQLGCSRNLTPLKDYTGPYKAALVKMEEHLNKSYDVEFDSFVKDEGVSWAAVKPTFRKPYVVISTQYINNDGWIRDFNRIADLFDLTHIESHDQHAQFAMAHEYRHILQQHKVRRSEWKILDAENPNIKRVVPAYHLQPQEADANWFGLKELSEL